MTEVIAAFIGAIGVVLVAIIGAVGAAKLGVGTSQEKLVATLKELIAAQDQKIDDLKKEKESDNRRIGTLEEKVRDLEKLTISQARTIDNLTKGQATA
jgi:hypothetical protein